MRILFVRKKEAADKSYITVELKNNEIVQARIKGNELPDEQGKLFLAWYTNNVLLRMR